MDDRTLASLAAALEASPDNTELRLVLARAHLDRDEPAEAWGRVSQLTPEDLGNEEHRRTVARAALAAGHPDPALSFTDNAEAAETLLVRARVLLALDRQREGLDLYQRAVERNPALEDRDLRSRLSANVRTFPSRETRGGEGGRPKLRVISNDDTDETELDRLLHPETEQVDFGDVGGLDSVKKEIEKRIILPFQKPSLFQRFKKRVGGGILLYGPPGCGKTLLARATAGECNAMFFNVVISDVLDMYMGESERKLHALFEKARQNTPAVMFFDEIEALGGKRQYTRSGSWSKLVSQFLTEMDGFARNNSGVLILGATNLPWVVDPAFRRPGRFDRVLFVPPPDRAAREAILEILLDDRPTAGEIDLGKVAKKTSGFSGADLENLVESAADEAIEESLAKGEEIPITQAHLEKTSREVQASTSEWLTTARNYARYSNEGGQYDEVLRFLERHARR